MCESVSTAQVLREALRPIWRQFASGRTVSIGKVGILAHLCDRGPATASVLAASQRISPQAIATAVRELESDGLLTRSPDETDRRRIWIELTKSGVDRLEVERKAGLDWLENAIADRLNDDEKHLLDAIVPILRKLVNDDSAV